MTRPTAPSETNGRSAEVAALLAAARAVLENRAFDDAANAVLGACRRMLGAEAGLIAVRPPGKERFDIAFLDPGRLEIDATDGMPAQLRSLSSRAREGRAVFANELSRENDGDSAHHLRSAIIAPIMIVDEVAGLLALIDKPDGFSTVDSRFTEVFAELLALAMLNRRTINGLTEKEERAETKFRTLVEGLPDIVARFDKDLRHLYVSPVIEHLTGRPAEDYLGRTTREMGMPSDLVERWDEAMHRVFVTGQPERLEFAFPAPDGERYFDCQIIPERGPGESVPSVLSIARDVTDRWLAHEAERYSRHVAEALREATVALTRSLDRETI